MEKLEALCWVEMAEENRFARWKSPCTAKTTRRLFCQFKQMFRKITRYRQPMHNKRYEPSEILDKNSVGGAPAVHRISSQRSLIKGARTVNIYQTNFGTVNFGKRAVVRES